MSVLSLRTKFSFRTYHKYLCHLFLDFLYQEILCGIVFSCSLQLMQLYLTWIFELYFSEKQINTFHLGPFCFSATKWKKGTRFFRFPLTKRSVTRKKVMRWLLERLSCFVQGTSK